MTNKFKNRNVLILGGMGFIGSNLAIKLVSLGANVTIVDSMLPQYGGNMENIRPIIGKVNVNYSDIRDIHTMNFLVRDIDVIYSMAGQTSHIESMTDPMTDLDINARSQLSILESCRKFNPNVKILYASTRQLYGKPQYLPVDENHPVVPVDVNGINKRAAEEYYSLYSKVYGMKCVSLRLTNTYGPRQHLHGEKQGFVGVFVRKAIDGEEIKIFGDGKQLRDFNYIDDVVDAFLLATDNEAVYGNVYNLGADNFYSLLQFIESLQQNTSVEYTIIPFPEDRKKIDIGDFYSSYTLFNKLTGWKPTVELNEGLRDTVAYFKPRKDLYW